MSKTKKSGFTIVELLIVIVVIAILATISIIAYQGITKRAAETTLQSDLRNASTKLATNHATDGSYPNPSLPSDIKASNGNTFQYNASNTSYCLSATSSNTSANSYYITNSSPITQGLCSGHTPDGSTTITSGSYLQAITSANCPTTRTRAVDRRDNHTYWVQQLADGKCWMLTNLAYAGGGTNTYGDVKTMTNGASDSFTYTQPRYFIPLNANPTSGSTDPSTSTDGGATNPQYGYMYNWCAAMGGQMTAACANGTVPSPNVNTSVCPAGWRLPVGGASGEFTALNVAINGGATNTTSGLLSGWLGQWSGIWIDEAGATNQGVYGYYWSSTQSASTYAHKLTFYSNWHVDPAAVDVKGFGFAVRCVAV